ncbi:hypothetical protein QG37_03865 [Candidozyma auris]|uniref:Uncharacterized protein n=1 Tax=Candidozyma auris TaxID=498019 RepID=A0A0L0NYR5_CANAR|nr:hypothetical protein QG37_03865 [[Candida] auris]
MYLPTRGSHLTNWLPGSKQEAVISETELDSWLALVLEKTGAYDTKGKWILGYGTKFVWNSFKSTFKEPSNLKDAVTDETTWAINEFNELKFGLEMPKFLRHMS